MPRREDLAKRLLRFGAAALRLAHKLPSDKTTSHIVNQLTRSATSVGANYAEARGAESRQDFVHKLRIADKEARESWYWLGLIEARWEEHAPEASALVREADELVAILTASIRTATRGGRGGGGGGGGGEIRSR